jgi:hypothetical protein
MSRHIEPLALSLEALLAKADLSLWLMIDRLDELFARRSQTEQKALRGLLHTIRLFRSERLRVKVFLRDDILDHIVAEEGFTGLSHSSARKSDRLRWSEDQILAMVVRRIFARGQLRKEFAVDIKNCRLTQNISSTRSLRYFRILFIGHLIRARHSDGSIIIPKMVEELSLLGM